MSSIAVSPQHGILFVLDPTNKDVVVPLYVEGELTAATETCVSIGTQAPVDGDVEVSLSLDATAPPNLRSAFAGRIVTPGGKVAITTAELPPMLVLDVPQGKIDVSIWVDDIRNPAIVSVNVKPVVL